MISVLIKSCEIHCLFNDSLRSAHAHRPICTLRISTFLALSLRAPPAPCECSFPGWDPTPQNPTPPHPFLRTEGGGGREPIGPLGPLRGPGGPLIRNENCSEWIRMEFIQGEEIERIIRKYRETLTKSQAGAVSLCLLEFKKWGLLGPTSS